MVIKSRKGIYELLSVFKDAFNLEKTSAFLKKGLALFLFTFLQINSISFVNPNPTKNPKMQLKTSPYIVKAQLDKGPKSIRASSPIVMAASPAPVIPAIKACDSLLGMPNHQAKTPQAITPTMPAHKASKATA